MTIIMTVIVLQCESVQVEYAEHREAAVGSSVCTLGTIVSASPVRQGDRVTLSPCHCQVTG